MVKKCKSLNGLLKEWNEGKVPKTKKGLVLVLKRTNDELASGWHAPNKEYLEELRCLKYGLQKKLKNMR